MFNEDWDIDDLTPEEEKKLLYFKETGIPVNYTLKKTVENDRIESTNSEGVVTIYPNLEVAVDIVANEGEDKANLKSRIRKTIIEQSGLKIKGMYWDVNTEDYLKRV